LSLGGGKKKKGGRTRINATLLFVSEKRFGKKEGKRKAKVRLAAGEKKEDHGRRAEPGRRKKTLRKEGGGLGPTGKGKGDARSDGSKEKKKNAP